MICISIHLLSIFRTFSVYPQRTMIKKLFATTQDATVNDCMAISLLLHEGYQALNRHPFGKRC